MGWGGDFLMDSEVVDGWLMKVMREVVRCEG